VRDIRHTNYQLNDEEDGINGEQDLYPAALRDGHDEDWR
jgi:hypothetical protein